MAVAIKNNNRSILFGEIIVVYCEIDRKRINKLCGQSGECLFFDAGGSYSQVLFEACLGLVQK